MLLEPETGERDQGEEDERRALARCSTHAGSHAECEGDDDRGDGNGLRVGEVAVHLGVMPGRLFDDPVGERVRAQPADGDEREREGHAMRGRAIRRSYDR